MGVVSSRRAAPSPSWTGVGRVKVSSAPGGQTALPLSHSGTVAISRGTTCRASAGEIWLARQSRTFPSGAFLNEHVEIGISCVGIKSHCTASSRPSDTSSAASPTPNLATQRLGLHLFFGDRILVAITLGQDEHLGVEQFLRRPTGMRVVRGETAA